MAETLTNSPFIPCKVVYKVTGKSPDEILQVMKEVNFSITAGIITWMHTFSPSKMWINGLALLQKPYLHLHTHNTIGIFRIPKSIWTL